MWHEIKNNDDIEFLMNEVRYFHDSCIKEFRYDSGAYVGHDLFMSPFTDNCVLNLIIQRQFGDHPVIELEFKGIKRLNMFIDSKQTCEIFDAALAIRPEGIYWLDSRDMPEDKFEDYKGVMICASELRWRYAEKYLGKQDVFVYSK